LLLQINKKIEIGLENVPPLISEGLKCIEMKVIVIVFEYSGVLFEKMTLGHHRVEKN